MLISAQTNYRGRFAPSPTGPLHFGSLTTALSSYLDAHQNHGKWLLRIEDLDPPREPPGTADIILRTLEKYHLYWDEDVIFQSRRHKAYEELCQHLHSKRKAYFCTCSRSNLKASGHVYPGYCRHKQQQSKTPQALRFQVPSGQYCFTDSLQGKSCQELDKEIGDFIIKRKDALYAYQLAVVADDHLQGITHIMRGIDLLDNTPRQIALQQALQFATPEYSHLPIIMNANGQKLSKQNLAKPLSQTNIRTTLLMACNSLMLKPPTDLKDSSIDDILLWAKNNWNKSALFHRTHLNCPTNLPD